MTNDEKIRYLCNTIDSLRSDYEDLLNEKKDLEKKVYEQFKKLTTAKEILTANTHLFKSDKYWDQKVYEFL